MASESARKLRKNSTDAERRLWSALRDRRLAGFRFRRQHPIAGFIVDFACTKYRIVVEADGSQHFESSSDERRIAIPEGEGWSVLRFWNNDILSNTEGVILAVLEKLNDRRALTRSLAVPATTLSRGAGEGFEPAP